MKDNWINKSAGMLCQTCMYFVPKADEGESVQIGRCRKHAPTLDGWPVMMISDWCGDHKLDKDRVGLAETQSEAGAYAQYVDRYNKRCC